MASWQFSINFAINRNLPEVEIGDLMVIHDAGAHGHAMGFNYNGKLRSAELLMRPGGEILEIRRTETVADYFATLDFEAFNRFQPQCSEFHQWLMELA